MKTSAIIVALAAAFGSATASFSPQLENHAVVRRADGDAGMANMPGMNSDASAPAAPTDAKPTRDHDAVWSATHVSKSHDAAWSATHVAKSHDAAWSATKVQDGAAVASATAAGSVATVAAAASATSKASAASATSKASATSAAGAATARVAYTATSKAPKPATYTGAAAPRDIAGSMFGFVAGVVAAAAI